jgi:hypothetical protein
VLEGHLKFVPRQGFAFHGVNPERVLEYPARNQPGGGRSVAPHAFLGALDVARPVKAQPTRLYEKALD